MSAEAMATAAGFVQQLAKDLNNDDLELPMFPDSVIRIQQVFSAEEVDIDEIVQIISSDPGLAARMLQLANSAAVRGNIEITEVRQAVIRIGNKLVQSSAVAFALRQAEQNEQITDDCRAALKEIWTELQTDVHYSKIIEEMNERNLSIWDRDEVKYKVQREQLYSDSISI